jgi:MFS family permease
VSALHADASPRAGYAAAVVWLLMAAFTLTLPEVPAPKSAANPTLRERLGLDALVLLKNHDHRVVFVISALFCIPLTAFYPYTPPHLQEAGFGHTSAWMSLGQVTEIVAMFVLGAMLTHWRLKWIFTLGLVFGVLRFGLCALDERAALLAGVALHGCSFTLVFITGQIYLEERIDPAWRARAQALLALVTGGVGNLAGYLATGWWFAANARPPGQDWPVFWSGLALAVGAVLGYFLVAYHGRGTPPKPTTGCTN